MANCPHCHVRFDIPDGYSDKEVKCPKCKKTLIVAEIADDSHDDLCSTCGRIIAESEGAYVTDQGLLMCYECDAKLSAPERASNTIESKEQDKDDGTIEKQGTEISCQESAKPSLEQNFGLISSTQVNLPIALVIVSWFCLISSFFGYEQGVNIYILARVIAAIGFLVLLYRFWQVLQVENLATTPFLAIILLFIPIVNLFWIFRVFWGWMLSYNKVISKFHLNVSPLRPGLGFAASIAPLLIAGGFLFVGDVISGDTQYYVKRGGEVVGVKHQGQLKAGEQVYIGAGKMLLPSSPENLPESKNGAIAVFLIILLLSDLIYIAFFHEGRRATNSLIEQIEFEED